MQGPRQGPHQCFHGPAGPSRALGPSCGARPCFSFSGPGKESNFVLGQANYPNPGSTTRDHPASFLAGPHALLAPWQLVPYVDLQAPHCVAALARARVVLVPFFPGQKQGTKGTGNELASYVRAKRKVHTTYMLMTPRYRSSSSGGQDLHTRNDVHDAILDAIA